MGAAGSGGYRDRVRTRRWRPGPVHPQPVNRVRAGRQQLSAESEECRRPPGRLLRVWANRYPEGCESGRIGTLGKRVWGNSPWVRIPPSPLSPGRCARSEPGHSLTGARSLSPSRRSESAGPGSGGHRSMTLSARGRSRTTTTASPGRATTATPSIARRRADYCSTRRARKAPAAWRCAASIHSHRSTTRRPSSTGQSTGYPSSTACSPPGRSSTLTGTCVSGCTSIPSSRSDAGWFEMPRGKVRARRPIGLRADRVRQVRTRVVGSLVSREEIERPSLVPGPKVGDSSRIARKFGIVEAIELLERMGDVGRSNPIVELAGPPNAFGG